MYFVSIQLRVVLFHLAKKREILQMTEQMLQYLNSGNIISYTSMCSSDHTCFDPLSMGNLITGHDFQKYLFARKTRIH